MSIAFDTGSTGEVAPGTPLSFAHTVGASSNRLLIVAAVTYGSSDPLSAATVTYGGVSLGAPIVTALASIQNCLYVWMLVAPASGTANIVITPSASAYVIACGVSASGVDQSTPVSATARAASSFGVSPYSNAIASVSGGTVLDFLFYRSTGASSTAPDGTQTQIARLVGTFPTSLTASYRTDPVTSMQWTFTNSGSATVSWAGLSLNPVSVPDLAGNVDLGSITPGGGFGSSASDIGGNVDLGGVAPGGGFGVMPGTINLSLRNANGGTWPLTAVPWLTFGRLTDAVQVLSLNNRVTDAASALSISNAALVPGQWYAVTAWHTDGTKIGAWVKQAV